MATDLGDSKSKTVFTIDVKQDKDTSESIDVRVSHYDSKVKKGYDNKAFSAEPQNASSTGLKGPHLGSVACPKEGRSYVNTGQEDQMEIIGYCPHTVRNVITWVCIVLTVGFLRLVFYWKPEWMLLSTHVKCGLNAAKKILLKDQYMQWFVEEVKEMTLHCTSVAAKNSDGNKRSGDEIASVVCMADTTSKAASFNEAIIDCDADECPLFSTNNSGVVRYFVSKKVKYLWNPTADAFVKVEGLDTGQSCSYFHEAQPLTADMRSQHRLLYGDNVIDVRVDSVIRLLLTQALNPFYIFQVFSCIVWFLDEYMSYALVIIAMSVISLGAEVYQTRTMQKALKKTISGSTVVSVCKDDDEYEDMSSDKLVPGDIIEVPRHGCIMQCDAILLTGNCIVNESMLTGESVPVTKTPLPNPRLLPHQPELLYNMKEHGRHTLFCGTQVIQTRYYGRQKVKAIVLRTGFSTVKGELVRSIMFPKPVDFQFSQDTYKFIGVLAGIASIGMIYTVVIMVADKISVGKIFLRMLDLITIVIPPALPAAMTIGTVFAQNRLKKEGIFCISPKSITLCGAINTFCFDKTGTLTEDGLDMWGVVPVKENKFADEVKEIPDLAREPIVIAMATCHSLTIIEGKLCGDPLDLRMFESTEWDLEEPGEDTSKFDVFMPTVVRPKTPDLVRTSETFDSCESLPFEVGILRQFTFSSKLQRMSVIARVLGKTHFDLYAKGAPEMIASLSRPSTVPSNFHDVLLKYTKHGYRVLALAWKPLKKLNYVKVQRAEREQLERDLIFLGLLVMENRLKARTMSIIRQLKDANIRTIMVTGDNMLTALSVARDCHIVEPCDKTILVQVVPPTGSQEACIQWNYAEDVGNDVKEIKTKRLQEGVNLQIDVSPLIHFAITGKSWMYIRQYFPELLHKLVVRGTVFARFSPEQKQQLVEVLQELGYYVGMCGDGANDCGALKTAHTGISLSEAEASVASPFTSKTPDISCVPTTIREGRAALVTSFGVFKYMAAYSLTQFVSVCMLYWIGANLTDFAFLYIDLFIITSLAATFGYTGAYPALSRDTPPISLISITPILSIVLHIILITAFQVIAWVLVLSQPWFEAYVMNEEDSYDCYEMTALFNISMFQYVTLAVVFSKGSPYRKSLYSNVYFLLNIILLVALNVWVVIYPTDGLAEFLELKLFPSMAFRALMLGLAFVNFFLCYLLEDYVLESNFVHQRCQKALERRRARKALKYLSIEQELCASPDWPPISQTYQSLAELMQMENSMPHHIPENAVHHYTDDDDGDDDFTSDASHCNTPAKLRRNIFRSHSGRSRRRTKSTTSSGSRYSANDVRQSSDRLTLSDTTPITDKHDIQNGLITQAPTSPTSPTLPLLDNQFALPCSAVADTPVTDSEVNIVGGQLEKPCLREETRL